MNNNIYNNLMRKYASAEDRRELSKRANGLTDKVANVADMAKKWISNNPEIAIGAGVGGVGGAVAGGAAKGVKGAIVGGLSGAAAGGAAGYGYKKYQDSKAPKAAPAKPVKKEDPEQAKQDRVHEANRDNEDPTDYDRVQKTPPKKGEVRYPGNISRPS